ncbi:MAG: hypothetical protein V8Q42_12755 [Anaerovoracaceae bacterium]
MLEGVIYPDEDAAKIFLDYFNEYIADGYLVDRLLQESGADEEPGEIRRISLTVLMMSTAASGL